MITYNSELLSGSNGGSKDNKSIFQLPKFAKIGFFGFFKRLSFAFAPLVSSSKAVSRSCSSASPNADQTSSMVLLETSIRFETVSSRLRAAPRKLVDSCKFSAAALMLLKRIRIEFSEAEAAEDLSALSF